LSDNVAHCEVFTGLFLSDFVLEGLAAHFNMTSTVCPELQVDNEPCGALAIATVAVSLIMWFLFLFLLFTGRTCVHVLGDRSLYR